ncbi:hypothetical protein D3C78_1680180 [compost metagenome]
MILQTNLLAGLELALLHQLLEVLAPHRPLALVRLQLHEVAVILARVMPVRRGAVLQQLAADD